MSFFEIVNQAIAEFAVAEKRECTCREDIHGNIDVFISGVGFAFTVCHIGNAVTMENRCCFSITRKAINKIWTALRENGFE